MSATNKLGVVIEVGSKWEKASFMPGAHSPFKIMGFVEGYAVMRRKRCAPILAHINTFGTEYLPK